MDQFDNRNEFRDTATVVEWNAEKQVRSLLGNTSITGDIRNLVVNQPESGLCPFDKYVPPDGLLSEVITGNWYDRTHAAMVARHAQAAIPDDKRYPPFLIPIILGMNATGVDANQRFKTEPLLFTLAIIGEAVRNKTDLSWRPLGLQAPLDHKSSNARKRERQGDEFSKMMKSGLNTRNYHQ